MTSPATVGALVPIRRQGTVLLVRFPVADVFDCTEEGCRSSFSASSWTATRRSLERHLERNHGIRITGTRNVCCKCHTDLGPKPSKHSCGLPTPQGVRQLAPVVLAYPCQECGRTFATNPGLRNHLMWHRDQGIRARNDVELPQPETRRRTRNRAVVPAVPATGDVVAVPPPRAEVPVPSPGSSISMPDSSGSGSEPATPAQDASARLADVPVPVTAGPSAAPDFPVSRQVEDLSQSPELSPSWEAAHTARSGGDLSVQQMSPAVRPGMERRGVPLEHLTPLSSRVSELGTAPVREGTPTAPQVLEESMDVVDGDPQVLPVEDNLIIDVDDKSQIHEFLPEINEILRAGTSDDNWLRFQGIMQRITDKVREIVKIPVHQGTQRRHITIDPEDPATIQKLYRRNRRKAVRLILGEEGKRCDIDKDTVTAFFRESSGRKDCDLSMYTPQHQEIDDTQGRPGVATNRVTPNEVMIRLRRCENTAPGDDRITYKHWKSVDPACSVLASIFNVCLKYEKIPEDWKTSITSLLYKKGDPHDIANWRPIAIMRTIYKLYTGVLARRFTTWMANHNILAPAQKGFMPHDGVFEHNYTLRRKFDIARTEKGEFLAAWLDFSNAFGSVPHQAIYAGLEKTGAGAKFKRIIQDMYTNTSTRILTGQDVTDNIDINAGVKQGCPISGLLFNIAIDPIIRHIQGQQAEHKILAYADDLVLLAKEPEELQGMINSVYSLAAKINMRLNPGKCFTLHLSGQTPIGTRDTQLYVGGEPIKQLEDGEFDKFLGKPVGFHITSNLKELADLMLTAKKLLQSKLAPWQKLDAIKTFFYTSLNFLMRTAQFAKGDWAKLDDVVRAEIKKVLHVPQEAANDYIYGPSKSGCIGLPVAASDSDFHLIDNAFKLLSSKDVHTAELALDDLQSVVSKRLSRLVDQDDVAAYLTGENEGEFRRNTNAISSTWTQARKSSARCNVEWSFQNYKPAIKIEDKTLRSAQRYLVLRTLRDNRRNQHLTRLLELPSQGKVIDCVSADPASSHFIRTGLYTRFADWRFIHRARLNLLPLNGSRHHDQSGNRSCRRCGYESETLPHVINHCMRYSDIITRRHNAVVSRVRKAAQSRFTILAQNQVVEGNLRPDLVLVKDGNAVILDVTIPFDNRTDAFGEARRAKQEKYQGLAEALSTRFQKVEVDAIVLGSLGSWDPENDKIMKRLCSKKYLTLFKKLCVSDVIRYSRDIYAEHISGVRQ